MRAVAIVGMLSVALLTAAAPAHRAHKPVPHTPTVPLTKAEAFLAGNARVRGVLHTASGLQYRVLTAGAGPHPTDTDVALINYVGTLTDGKMFDQSAQPTPLAVSGVVPGFAEALKLMPKGAKYRVWIKPSLGYGDRAAGPIPPGSVLVFDIELLDFMSQDALRQLRQQQAPAPAG